MAVVYRRVKKCGRKVDLVILHMDIVHLAAVLVYLTTMAVVYRRVKKFGRKVDMVILHMDIVHLAAVCHSAPLASATSSRPNLQIVNLDELITIEIT
jgi:hypothetical protein